MSSGNVVGLSGNLSRPSKTRALVETVVSGVSQKLGLAPRVYELNDFGESLGASRSPSGLDVKARAIIEAIIDSRVLVVGTPTYKGSYTGLFKHIFDLIDPLALMGKPVILTATGGSDRHALIIEHQLRPLFGFFAAHTAPTGIFAIDRDFSEGAVASEQVASRIRQSLAEIALLASLESLLLAAE